MRFVAGLLIGLVIAGCVVGLTSRVQASGTEHGQFVELFGPVQNQGSLVQVAPTTYGFPGAATSTSCKKFWFDQAWSGITWAALKMEWIPTNTNNRVRLIDADDGPTNIQQITEVVGVNNSNPVAVSVDVTAAMQGLASAGVPKNVCWQIKGDNATTMRVYQIYLELLTS